MSNSLVLATWNLNSIRIRTKIINAWMLEVKPDALCMQETKVMDGDFPEDQFDYLGYEVDYHGQKSYNGVAIASKVGLEDTSTGLPGLDDGHARVIESTIGGIRLMSVYAPNGGDEKKLAHKVEFFAALKKRMKVLRDGGMPVVVGGDFNVAPHDDDVYDIEDYGHDGIGVKPIERKIYNELLELGYVDAHKQLDGASNSHTWWDYRGGSYANDRGLRIDHFLVHGCKCESLEVDHAPRKMERPSDHTPVVLKISF